MWVASAGRCSMSCDAKNMFRWNVLLCAIYAQQCEIYFCIYDHRSIARAIEQVLFVWDSCYCTPSHIQRACTKAVFVDIVMRVCLEAATQAEDDD
mmetsp:Transcript_21020/g.32070  ORF Transcript_21020/g.32070 Transcript_21020/m.32070 type:complete len:95 (+) Transcript_21020:88-372(+)